MVGEGQRRKTKMNGTPQTTKVALTDIGSKELIFINVIASALVKMSDWTHKIYYQLFTKK